MKRLILTSVVVLLVCLPSSSRTLSPRCRELLDSLMMKFDSLEVYENRKLERIGREKDLCMGKTGGALMDAWLDVAGEYRSYDSDSTILYLDKVRKSSIATSDSGHYAVSVIRLSRIMTVLGFFKESEDILKTIDRSSMSPSLWAEYYEAFLGLYGELYHINSARVDFGKTYRREYLAYMDSVVAVAPPESEYSLRAREKRAWIEKDYAAALEINARRIELAQGRPSVMSLAKYDRYVISRSSGNLWDEGIECLLEAANIDLEEFNQDVGSFAQLGYKLKNVVGVDVLDKFSDYSFSSMMRFGSKTRKINGVEAIVIADKLYQKQLMEQKRQLTLYLVLISVLAGLLVLAVFYTGVLIKKGRVLNSRLERSNRISNSWLAGFFQLYSSYIDRLLAFRGRINTSLRRGNTDYVIELTNPSRDITNDELKHMYDSFDSAFLDIFPTFVEDFNSLLKPECRIVLKDSERLNTELRIFAMIKLGVTESARISELLHYSIKTVYNKRSGINAKLAVSKEKFETVLGEL